jgi:hypothetical protein
MTHKHEWAYSYRSKYKGEVEDVYKCECGEFKRTKAGEQPTRLSNMGGKFSTEWRP